MRELGNLIFDDIDFKEYGIQISGSGVYDAPERDVTKYEIPGRNGDLIQDNGRFKNIKITYPCNITKDFATKADAFREAIKSKFGYKKIVDTYHPGEYRMGVYIEGLEFSVGTLMANGTADITFDCKPQRYLAYDTDVVIIDGTSAPLYYEFVDTSDFPSWLSSIYKSYPEKNAICFFPSKSETDIHFELYYNKKGTTSTYIYYTDKEIKTAEFGRSNEVEIIEGKLSTIDSGTNRYVTVMAYPTAICFPESKLFPDEMEIENPCFYASKPLICIKTDGRDYSDRWHYVFGIGKKNAILIQNPSYLNSFVHLDQIEYINEIYIDAETMDAYVVTGGGKVSMNKYVKIIGNLNLGPGINTINTNNEVTSVTVYPRWYTI